MNETKKYGLIGFPLSHSFSASYFTEKFEKERIGNSEYRSYPIPEIKDICELMDSGLIGLNVTIPYKETVMPFLDELSFACQEIKAVNTILIKDGVSKGYNTDVIGFKETLLRLLDGQQIEKGLILGSGGASKAVKYVLRKLGIRHTIVSRKSNYLQYSDLTKSIISSHKLIVNTTPLGMYPQEKESPNVPYEHLTKEHFLYDLIYNPEKTIFLKQGELAGAKIKNGHDMLIAQAEASWNIWNQK